MSDKVTVYSILLVIWETYNSYKRFVSYNSYFNLFIKYFANEKILLRDCSIADSVMSRLKWMWIS